MGKSPPPEATQLHGYFFSRAIWACLSSGHLVVSSWFPRKTAKQDKVPTTNSQKKMLGGTPKMLVSLDFFCVKPTKNRDQLKQERRPPFHLTPGPPPPRFFPGGSFVPRTLLRAYGSLEQLPKNGAGPGEREKAEAASVGLIDWEVSRSS